MIKDPEKMDHDENNNEEVDQSSSKSGGLYVERHLELGADVDFLIIPNGGTGDCMFKAVSQAVFNGDESKHKEIRKKVVDFVIAHRWERFSEFIQVQHFNGDHLLQRQWATNPKQAYRMYLSLPGTLGSSSELTAAAELYEYNFVTIQEYCNNSQRTYRVEHCPFPVPEETKDYDLHYFYFTGDFDNGHWEYLKNMTDIKIEDGTYHGRHKTLIDGEEITIEAWLQRETENNNSSEKLKRYTDHSLYNIRRSSYPFEMRGSFSFDKDGIVNIGGSRFTVENIEFTDLFSVLTYGCTRENSQETEVDIIKERFSNFEDINYKLITQPWSHNFTTEAIKYCGYAIKGNIQDLICAADTYRFSFVLFMKLEDNDEESGSEVQVHRCKFTPVDRWGGEHEKTLYFFMRLVPPTGRSNSLIAKWWLLTPHRRRKSSRQRKSKVKLEDDNINLPVIQAIPKVSSVQMVRGEGAHFTNSYDVLTAYRPTTEDTVRNSCKVESPRPITSISASPYVGFNEDNASFEYADVKKEENEQEDDTSSNEMANLSQSGFSTSEGDIVDDSMRQDFENIFGTEATETAYSASACKPDSRLIKKRVRPENMKPATGKDLARHPEKVKTVVKVRDKRHAGREITYQGKGYMETGDVLNDLKTQGLIKMPTTPPSSMLATSKSKTKQFSFDKVFKAVEKNPESRNLAQKRDENFNPVHAPTKEDHDESDATYEKEKSQLQFHQSSSTDQQREQLFSKAIMSYLNMEKSKVKIKNNKVSPKASDVIHHTVAAPASSKTNDDFSPPRMTLLLILKRIIQRLRKWSDMFKRGIRRRYERYNGSSPKFDFSSVGVPKRNSSDHSYDEL